jgi:hypothetical protein
VLQEIIMSVTKYIKILRGVHLADGGEKADKIHKDLEDLLATAQDMVP